ncbi:PRC-barrel domain containing protein [Streptomyces sp. WMMC940]|uniref:PRC-barrel domain containing protein n=1 Tax=Streptomyces sp. WMMC940 TaxID=3015153 RepID=UPI0022B70AA6|nr:PRC-barrel domain containing protein [Streptomyces sp. WMMC940]MCZ7456729.1 PRC-barrel domain containing protein [Streptomyces sp. WMMC940]
MGAGMWGFPESSGHAPGAELVGYRVEATDGPIGKIDKHSEDVGRCHIVVDTGPWILGHRRLVPAGVVSRIDREREVVYLDCPKEQIKEAPDFERGRYDDAATVRLIEQHYAHWHL